VIVIAAAVIAAALVIPLLAIFEEPLALEETLLPCALQR